MKYLQTTDNPAEGLVSYVILERKKKNKRKEIHSHTRAIVRIIVSYASSDRKNTEEPNKTVKQYKLTSTKRTHSPHIGHHWRFGQNPLEAGLGRRSALKVHHSSSTSVGLDIDGWKKWTYKLYFPINQPVHQPTVERANPPHTTPINQSIKKAAAPA